MNTSIFKKLKVGDRVKLNINYLKNANGYHDEIDPNIIYTINKIHSNSPCNLFCIYFLNNRTPYTYYSKQELILFNDEQKICKNV